MSHDVLHDVKAILIERGLSIQSESRIANDSGEVLKLKQGAVVNVYDNGRVFVQGGKREFVRELQSVIDSRLKGEDGAIASSRKVFVVYGHDTKARSELESLLRRLKLDPLILDQLPSKGQTVIEKIENFRNQAAFGIVLATPDDEGHVVGKSDEIAYRARQNVALELGMLLGMLGREKVAILIKNTVKMERPSDIQGLIYFPFTDSVEEVKLLLAKEMNGQGLKIDFTLL